MQWKIVIESTHWHDSFINTNAISQLFVTEFRKKKAVRWLIAIHKKWNNYRVSY